MYINVVTAIDKILRSYYVSTHKREKIEVLYNRGWGINFVFFQVARSHPQEPRDFPKAHSCPGPQDGPPHTPVF